MVVSVAAVKDSSSAVTGALSSRRRARAAAASVRSAAAALARTSWVAVSQAQASEMTSRGDPDRVRGCGLVVQQGGDQRAGLGDLFPVAAGQDRVVLGGADRQPVFFLPGRGVQPGQA